MKALLLLFCAAAAPSRGYPPYLAFEPARALLDPALRRLPTGSSKPRGWFLDELALQAKGTSGQLPYFWNYFNKSAWVNPPGTKGGSKPEQFVPYYLNGLVPLSYQVDEPDANLAGIRDRYVQFILAAAEAKPLSADGGRWLGDDVARGDQGDAKNAEGYWSKYPAVLALEQYAEATQLAGNSSERDRVLAALVLHHRQFYAQLRDGDPPLNVSRWGGLRYEDGIDGIQWLLDPARGALGADAATAFLWDLLAALRAGANGMMLHTADNHSRYTWEGWYEGGDPLLPGDDDRDPSGVAHLLRHGVDVGQAMKIGALWWRVDGTQRELQNPHTALAWADRYLRMSDGMYFGDEEIGGDHTASRGTETCSVVETMYSMRVAYEVTGNITFMDRLERIAYNALPAALWPDVTTNVYHHNSNQLACPGAPYSYGLYFCCSANLHQGWPKFVNAQVQVSTRTGRVVVSGYAPSASALPTAAGGGTLVVGGSYPFADGATITASAATELALRVPCWCEGATVTVAGGAAQAAPPCAFFNASLAAGGSLAIAFDTRIRLYKWEASPLSGQSKIQGGAVEVHRGPLTYALRPASNVTVTPLHDATFVNRAVQVLPNATWNYGLLLSSLAFEGGGAIPALPFDAEAPPPVRITAKARQVDAWEFSSGARGVAPVPKSPLSSSRPLVDIELVPMGSTNIRISVFPTLVS